MCCKTGLQDISTPDFSPQASTPDISSMKFNKRVVPNIIRVCRRETLQKKNKNATLVFKT
jgi:hypothetical protein